HPLACAIVSRTYLCLDGTHTCSCVSCSRLGPGLSWSLLRSSTPLGVLGGCLSGGPLFFFFLALGKGGGGSALGNAKVVGFLSRNSKKSLKSSSTRRSFDRTLRSHVCRMW